MPELTELVKLQLTEVLAELEICEPRTRSYHYLLGKRDALSEQLVTITLMKD